MNIRTTLAASAFLLITGFFTTLTSAAEQSVSKFKDGTYTGQAKGFDNDISLELEIAGGKIKGIKLLEQHESQPQDALKKIPEEIITKQSVENIDAVSGATYTSNGVINAVKDALKKAAGNINPGTMASIVSEPLNIPADTKELKLPAPKLDPSKSLAEALQNRRSIRDFDTEKELSLQTLSNLLWAASGVNRANGRKTAPSAFDWKEIEIYIAMKQGVFMYDPRRNILIKTVDSDIRASCGFQAFAKDAPVNLIYVANYGKMTGKGGPDMLRFYAAVDTGYISQNVYLFCASEGLATVVLGGVDKPALEKLMKLQNGSQAVILTQPVAYPKTPDDLKK